MVTVRETNKTTPGPKIREVNSAIRSFQHYYQLLWIVNTILTLESRHTNKKSQK